MNDSPRYICSLIVVENIETSKAFYRDVLGQKVQMDFGENVAFEGGFAIHLKEHYQRLMKPTELTVQSRPNNMELYFESTGIESLYQRLQQTDVEFVHELREQPWRQRVMRFYDPDGHIIEIGEPMESVVQRLHDSGLTVSEISASTSMPAQFVQKAVKSSGK